MSQISKNLNVIFIKAASTFHTNPMPLSQTSSENTSSSLPPQEECLIIYVLCVHWIVRPCRAPRNWHSSSDGGLYDLHGQTSRHQLCKLRPALSFPATGACSKAECTPLRDTQQFKPRQALLQMDLALQWIQVTIHNQIFIVFLSSKIFGEFVGYFW